MNAMVQELKKDKSCEYLGGRGDDRHLFRVPIDAVEEHADFQRLRGKAVERIDLLQASKKRAEAHPSTRSAFMPRRTQRALSTCMLRTDTCGYRPSGRMAVRRWSSRSSRAGRTSRRRSPKPLT